MHQFRFLQKKSLVMRQSNFIEFYGFNGLHKIDDNEFLSIFGASKKENLQPYLLYSHHMGGEETK